MTSQTRVQRLHVKANVNSTISMHKYEILDSEIISSDRCIKEYIPLWTSSPIPTPTPATTWTQSRDIQRPE